MSNKPVTTSPQNDAQLRSIINRLQKSQTTLIAELGDLEDVFLRTGTADEAIGEGEVIYASSNGGVSRAQANAAASSQAIGVAFNDAAMGEDVVYLTLGVVEMSGLTAGTVYYLSAVSPGSIVSTPDAGEGDYIVPVGRAVTNAELLFSPLVTVLL